MKPADKTKKHGKYTSIAITVAIVLMLILSGPASAVTLGISLDNHAPTKGDSITFTVNADINDPDKHVQIDNFSLVITGDTAKEFLFNPDGTAISSGITVVAINSPSSDEYGYGYGYGHDANVGYEYSFGYGYGYGYRYGYGYGYGVGGADITYQYEITLNTACLNTGSHGATLKLNTGESVKPSFSSLSVSFTVAAAESSSSSSTTTLVTTTLVTTTPVTQTKIVSSIADEKTASVSFTKTDVTGIEITVIDAASNVKVTVENLLTQPSSIPDVLNQIKDSLSTFSIGSKLKTFGYLSINVNIDDSNIDNAKVTFKVDKSWFSKNNIDKSSVKLARYHDGWDTLPTDISSEDDDYVYYVATTPGFSTFAIIGEEKIVATDKVTPPEELTPVEKADVADVAGGETPEEPASKSSAILIGIVLLVSVAALAYYIQTQKK